ncbi:MAG: ParB/RepB/Spo0J family partition protein [Micrococcales bacterium]|nr:ParB/RepB/Spo0J family partition protein [Micrococcales bacterium]
MSDRRRGLGRGLGALIPTEPSALSAMTRPRDVFFADTGAETPAPHGSLLAPPTNDGQTAPVEVPRETGKAVGNPESSRDLAELDAGGRETPAKLADASPGCGAAPPAGAELGADPSSGSTALRDDAVRDNLAPVPGARYALLPVSSITPNARQPRQYFDEDELAELVESIREIGMLQPVVVRPVSHAVASGATDSTDGKDPRSGPVYELVMGERRWRACQAAGQTSIPAIVKETSDDAMLRNALLENLHRSQLNPLEEAAAYQQLLEDFGCTHEELANRLGRSRPQISNVVRLLKLPPLVQRRVAAGVLSAGHARALLGLPDTAAMERLAQRIVAEGLSVRSVEEIVALGGEPERPARAAQRSQPRMAELDELAAFLADRWETRVSIAMGRHKGRLTVEFASVDDLNRILDAIGEGPETDGRAQSLAG